jgi:hypothetical protein
MNLQPKFLSVSLSPKDSIGGHGPMYCIDITGAGRTEPGFVTSLEDDIEQPAVD